MKKGFSLVELMIVMAIIGILSATFITAVGNARAAEACGFWTPCGATTETTKAQEVTKTVIANIPVPKLTTSSERKNVAKRAEIFNNEDKISYIYLISYGKVMAFYTVQGKVSSLRSYMTPTQKIVTKYGNECNYDQGVCTGTDNVQVVDAPDIDGTYGENVEGIFFFTTEGAYVEWKGEYMMSDQPLKLTTQPELVREIK